MYQFGHMQWAARSRTQKRSSSVHNGMKTRAVGWSAQDLADEAERMDGACEHVADPQPPTVVYGVSPSQAAAEAAAWGDQATEAGGKKLRSTSPVLAAGVISVPAEMVEQWPAYRDTAIEALQERYGERLRSVVEHRDEAHPHIHFYLVPKPGESFGAVHEGYAARAEERAKGAGAKVRTAYQQAMSAWQDWLHERVSARFGLARTGPKRERMDRDDYLRQKAVAQELAAAEAARIGAEKVRAELEAAREEVKGQIRALNVEKRELERMQRELTDSERARLNVLQQAMPELKAERDALQKQLKTVTAERDGLKADQEAREELKKAGISRGFKF